MRRQVYLVEGGEWVRVRVRMRVRVMKRRIKSTERGNSRLNERKAANDCDEGASGGLQQDHYCCWIR